MKIKRILMRVLVVLLIILAAAFVLRAVLNYTTGKKLDEYLRTAQAAGTPLAMKDIVPSCPDSDNAALLWKAADDLFLLDKGDRDLADNTINDLFYGRVQDEPARARLAKLVEKNRKSLDLLIAAAGKPCFRYGDWSKASVSVSRPNAVSLIQMTRLLALDAVLRAGNGQINQALDECRSALRFIPKLLDEPFLVSGLVALADMKIVLISVTHILREADPDPQTLASWIAELDPRAWRPRFLRCLSGERAFVLECGLDVLRGKRAIFDEMEATGFFQRLSYWMLRPALKSDLIWMQIYFDELQRNEDQSYYQLTGFFEQVRRRNQKRPWYFLLTGTLLPNFESAFLKEATLEATMLATRTGLACKLYRREMGRYPEKLADLVPKFLAATPVDPFTGRSLVYRVENGELLVYSLGSNQHDDGGRGTYKFDRMVMDKDDDWAWREKVK